MGYKRAEDIFPEDLLLLVQQYVDGEIIYIPRKGEKRSWGADTDTRENLRTRNKHIYSEYLAGKTIDELAAYFYLSPKSIQRIIRHQKSEDKNE